ncbi:uncharacterized protein BDV17DRAFT_293634 [Aspergillus undulatus]|uniref:uncharacterized protein n=1 Tax=Aspergillus undulatus TaxID=1810928 RepID=UPI003CCE2DEF
MAVQLAKHVFGANSVVGIIGSEEKCAVVERLGADRCVNHNSATFTTDLASATSSGISIYFDNTAGSILDAALNVLSRHGRIVACMFV